MFHFRRKRGWLNPPASYWLTIFFPSCGTELNNWPQRRFAQRSGILYLVGSSLFTLYLLQTSPQNHTLVFKPTCRSLIESHLQNISQVSDLCVWGPVSNVRAHPNLGLPRETGGYSEGSIVSLSPSLYLNGCGQTPRKGGCCPLGLGSQVPSPIPKDPDWKVRFYCNFC